MHHQSKERNMSKSQTKKKLTRTFPFGLARFRFNEVRINEVSLYVHTNCIPNTSSYFTNVDEQHTVQSRADSKILNLSEQDSNAGDVSMTGNGYKHDNKSEIHKSKQTFVRTKISI